MQSTSVNLLKRLKETGASEDWNRFVQLYTPLIYYWIRSRGLSTSDTAELVQEVLLTLVRKLPQFEYDPQKRFRAWLKTLTGNKVSDWHRRRGPEWQTEAADDVQQTVLNEPSEAVENQEYQQFVLARAYSLMQTEFEPTTWRAFVMYVSEGKSAAEVAAELGLTENAVRVAKCRVQRRLRQEFGDLLE
ncbi:MAG: sigma-70 family RNA polymerase sigma factor [Fuerstiella sp.]